MDTAISRGSEKKKKNGRIVESDTVEAILSMREYTYVQIYT